MDPEHRQLVNRLFAAVAAMLEDASAAPVAGRHRGVAVLAAHGRRLRATLRDITILAEAAVIVAALGAGRGWTRRKRLR